MRERGAAGVHALLCAVLGATLLTGCHGPSGSGEVAGSAAAPVRPSGYGAVFLAVGECSSFGAVAPTEVPCASERAAARVVAREDGRASNGPPCPATTDFVLHISERRPSADEDGDGAVPRGYACMRKLRPPHPGDPGGGGGPRTIVGDCVRETGAGRVREAVCDGEGGRGVRFKVVDAVADRADCPASTGLYVRLGGARPVGCARPL
ncbi:Lipoprotein OS=Streptomyces tendae OX=1932 GN=GUR47_08655 PE=4 SV=1 [Streptomyces tendae]